MLIRHAPIASKEAASLHVVHFITTECIVLTFAATAASSSAISKPGQCVYLDASLSALNCSMALLGFACAPPASSRNLAVVDRRTRTPASQTGQPVMRAGSQRLCGRVYACIYRNYRTSLLNLTVVGYPRILLYCSQ